MKKNIILTILLFVVTIQNKAQTFNYQRTWATYFGDESTTIYDTEIDGDGNVYIVGEVKHENYSDSNFTATPNSYQVNYGGGASDGFIAKISPDGFLIWSTFFGGENSEYINSIAIDRSNNIYVYGLTSSNTSIATIGAYQNTMEGGLSSLFLAKLTSSGDKVWCTYYDKYTTDINGSGSGLESITGMDIVVDNSYNLYISSTTSNINITTSNTFQTNINSTNASNTNGLISKFDGNGQRIWATYYGINGSFINSIAISPTGLYVSGTSSDCFPTYTSNTYFATPGCHQPTPGNCKDVFLSKFSLDGNREWSTYHGNSSVDYTYKRGLKFADNNIYLTGVSLNKTNITTIGAFQEDIQLSASIYLAKFDENGIKQWGTFSGNNSSQSTPLRGTINIDSNNDIFISGTTINTTNIGTLGAFQETKSNYSDAFLVKFNSSGQKQWGTYYGGAGYEYGSKPLLFNDSFYIIGSTQSSSDIATSGSLQPYYTYNSYQNANFLLQNIFIAKFDPTTMATNEYDTSSVVVFPNPNKGFFTIKIANFLNTKLQLFDINGRKVLEQNLQSTETTISTKNIASGIYLAKIYTDDKQVLTKKVVVE